MGAATALRSRIALPLRSPDRPFYSFYDKTSAALREAPQASVRLLAGNGQRVDERRELVLELLDSARAPALGQHYRHRVGEDLLFTTLDAVEDPLRDRL